MELELNPLERIRQWTVVEICFYEKVKIIQTFVKIITFDSQSFLCSLFTKFCNKVQVCMKRLTQFKCSYIGHGNLHMKF